MSKNRRLKGLSNAAKLITAGHLTPAAKEVETITEAIDEAPIDEIEVLRAKLAEAERRLAEQERQLGDQVSRARQGGAELSGPYELRYLNPDEFGTRPMDSDEIREKDIVEMRDMIDEQGLLQWPIVDAKNKPLAGRRRSYAIQRLADERADRYAAHFPHGVPVIAMLDIDWEVDPLRADQEMLLMQHTQRRRDKPTVRDAKIRDLATRMKSDPAAKWKGGRVAAGEYHALKRLSQLFGVSPKIIQRALAADPNGAVDDENPFESAHLAINRQVVAIERALEQLPELPPELGTWRHQSKALIAWLDRRRQAKA